MISTANEIVSYTWDTTTERNMITTNPVSAWFPDEDVEEEQRLDSLVSNDAIRIVEIVLVITLCGVISACGLVANVINVLVFFRQGALSSSCNVSLLALAIADMGCLVPVLCNSVNYAWHRLGQFSIFQTPKDLFDTLVIWPHIMCMQIVCWITAYIAFERCICVLFPLKVKFLFSAKISVCVNGLIAMIVIASFIPTFMTQKIAQRVEPITNDTRLVVVMTDLHIEIVHYSDIVHSMTLRPLALLVVFTCTHITIFRVKLSTTWRKSIVEMSSTSSSSQKSSTSMLTTTSRTTTLPSPSITTTTDVHTDQNSEQPSHSYDGGVYTIENPKTGDKISATNDSKNKKRFKESSISSKLSKETRLVKMITLISVIFMVCNAPDILGVYVLVFQMPTLGISFADNVFFLLVSCLLCLESINSSINIVVYYRMSSAYRHTLRTMMGWESQKR